ncbi:AI-2E family transporter [Azospira inquinata]|uniref:AI-2E family transporter n=1 Tax=Azospira inquinata TaxID=2785627 RepID=A0A975XV33_9RHOO|nr:AI-2E family transporter [Azospira inquinata]QWT45269.1 AI-2E family transporter [Azospira inquinata]QWT49399.1 AI-2E family transporter [Azospira inquinata]
MPKSAPLRPQAHFSPVDIGALILAGLALVLVLCLHLLPALLAGLLIYELTHLLAPHVPAFLSRAGRPKMVAVILLATLIITILVAAAMGITTFIAQEGGSPAALLQKMADIIEGTRPHLPLWLGGTLPSDPEVLKGYIIDWLRNHATELQGIGKDAGRGLVHILLGMVVGAIVALHQARPPKDSRPLAAALTLRAARLGNAFRRIVFAQVRIAALNACLTGLYLEGGLRLSGIDLPFSKTLIVLTFFIGLIPVLGNLVTNTIIVVVSLSVSVPVATASLVFLILIHKLEYFLNARIVGGQIDAHSWELLIAMLAMEAAFGVPGVIAAPVYYAYLKTELRAARLV